MFLRAYFSSKRILPGIPSEVFVSGSGVGFHLKIYKQVTIEEDLKIRALLWDDPYRLYYALKKWALNSQEEYVDLVFDEKNEKKETVIPLEKILKSHEKEVETITDLLNRGENEKADEEIKKLSKDLEPQLSRFKRPSYVGCIAFDGEDVREKLEKICADIAAKDETFKYRFYPSFYLEHDWIVAIIDTDKDRVWKRLTWLKNKTVLKDMNAPLWVKERIAT
jgi:hypothetical protein